MNSSSRLLAAPQLGPTPRALDAPAPALDEFLAAQVARARAAAYAEGQRDGAEQARRELGGALERLERAFASAAAEVRTLQRTRASADVDLAEAIAAAVLGREPHDGGQVLVARLRAALADLDDAPLQVRVHPADADLVAAAVAREGEVGVTADASLAEGEAVVEGRWARADLTRAAAWEVVRGVLAEPVEHGDG